MKHYPLILSVLSLVLIASCQEKEPAVSEGALELSDVTVPESIKVPGELKFSALVSDDAVDLSTLEVSASLEDGTQIANKSIRTPGKEAKVEDALNIPFAASMAEGSELIVSFEAINVNGKKESLIKKTAISRPVLPETLYMKVGDNTLEMKQSLENAHLYETAEGEYESIATAVFATAEDFSAAEFIWGTSTEDNKAQICSFSEASGVAISYPSVLVKKYTFNTLTFEVGVIGDVLEVAVNGTKLTPNSGILYASVEFKHGAEVTISGVEDVENAYNRDFFGKDGDKFTFLRESGTYDVYYSPKYNYFWVNKMAAVAPECLWIIGHGFTCAPVWHPDFGFGGWTKDNPLTMGYAPKIAENKYQCSMYLSAAHEWGSFEFEVYSDLNDSKELGFAGKSLSGFTKGVALSGAKDGKPGLTSASGFQAGYYVITFDNATGDINLNRITAWEDSGKSGILIKGVELDVDKEAGYDFADITFNNGEEVSFSGIEASEMNRDFFEIKDGKAKFVGVSGTYKVQYFPAYNYVWLSNKDMTFPDCIYILGSGKWAAPVYDDDNTPLWGDVAYNRDAPYFVVAPKIAENTYKATMSMSTSNKDWRVLLEFYSDANWGQDGVKPVKITGSAASRFTLNEEKGWLCGVDEKENPFVKGNYQLIITSSADGLSLDITKID